MAREEKLNVSVGASILHGSINGFVQTPAGGRLGSTTLEQPTYDELGFDRISFNEGYVAVSKGRHEMLAGVHLVRLSGKSTLSKDLTSQHEEFSAGDIVKADIKTDWHRFNYLYQLMELDTLGGNMIISPGAGVVVFDFHYKLAGITSKVDREYAKVGFRLGGEINLNLTDEFSFKTNVFASIPYPTHPQIFSSEFLGQYQLLKGRHANTKVIAGVAYSLIDYTDEQEVPNHIRVEMGPLLKVGVEFEF